MLNLEKIQKLLNHLKETPDESFDYTAIFRPDSPLHPIRNPSPRCCTAGCVMGHAIWLWRTKLQQLDQACVTNRISGVIGEFLGLDARQRNFVFFAHCGEANREDAIRRLEHLLAGQTVFDYDWQGESWQK